MVPAPTGADFETEESEAEADDGAGDQRTDDHGDHLIHYASGCIVAHQLMQRKMSASSLLSARKKVNA